MAFKGRIIVYSILGCPHCMRTKNALHELNFPFTDVRLDLYPHIKDEVTERSGVRTVPQIYFNEVFVGGNSDFEALRNDKAKFDELVKKVKSTPPPANAPVPPDPSTAVKDADPFNFQCEPDELFIMINDMRKQQVLKTKGIIFRKTNAFTGQEFADWAKGQFGHDKDKATEIGQTLIERHFIRHDEKTKTKFIVGKDLYLLVEEDCSEALNCGPISECKPSTVVELGEQLRKMILKLYGVFLSEDGRKVDYKGMKASSEFGQYKRMTQELKRINIEKCTREEKLAFFINIYNALVIHANIERGPPTSLWGRYKFFNSVKYIIGGNAYSLQDIENGVLRANRKGVGQFSNPFGKDDPRLKVALQRHEPLIHFGLVCGAKSCPPIKTYTPENIYKELNLACQAFLDNEESCLVELKSKTLMLSSIFKWYKEDFGSNNQELANFVLDHMGDGAKKEELQLLLKGKSFKVSYIKYDWSVNSK